MLKINLYTAVVSFFLAAMAPVPVALADERIYFFGNSYSYYNNGMWLMVKALLEEASPNTTVETGANTPNGAKLPRHLADLDGTNGDTAARQALITGNNTSWDLVILQDQSGVPAYTYSDLWWDSLNAGVELNKLIEPTGAVTMFLLTWGRQRGLGPDEFFTDYTKMQDYLTFGYRQYQLAANNPRSFVAPAGIAYQLIYDDTIAAGGTEENSPFRDLYQNDGSHPTKQGSYLAACTIFAAYTGISVAGLEWAPDGVGAERRDYLQSKADEAVFDDDTFFPSRWDLPDFAGPTGETDFKPTVSPVSASVAPVAPSAVTSDSPSVSPSAAPSTSPSAAPSVVPSVATSVSPSTIPSVSSSAALTTSPLAAPSVVPLVALSMSPSESPSVSPSAAPTKSFSPVPSVVLSIAPSASLSARPSESPSGAPITTPSAAPTVMPSVSVSPSARPSESPSGAPTTTPSAAPTAMPSVASSLSPSVIASVSPSRGPLTMPTLVTTDGNEPINTKRTNKNMNHSKT